MEKGSYALQIHAHAWQPRLSPGMAAEMWASARSERRAAGAYLWVTTTSSKRKQRQARTHKQNHTLQTQGRYQHNKCDTNNNSAMQCILQSAHGAVLIVGNKGPRLSITCELRGSCSSKNMRVGRRSLPFQKSKNVDMYLGGSEANCTVKL